jgi:hypothetical protein
MGLNISHEDLAHDLTTIFDLEDIEEHKSFFSLPDIFVSAEKKLAAAIKKNLLNEIETLLDNDLEKYGPIVDKFPGIDKIFASEKYIGALFNVLRKYSPARDYVVPPLPHNNDDSKWESIIDGALQVYDKPTVAKILGTLLSFAPMDHDGNTNFPDYKQRFQETVDKNPQYFPEDEMNAFVDIHNYLWNSVASIMLEPTDEKGVWKVDLSRYEKWGVRELYKNYGGIAKLDKDRIISITLYGEEHLYGTNGYNDALPVFMATIGMNNIMHLHAGFVHIFIAQPMYHKVTTSPVYDKLTTGEKEFLAVTLHRTNAVNQNIDVLVGTQGSLLHRSFGWSLEGMVGSIKENLTNLSKTDLKQFVLGHPGTAWHEKVKGYYSECEKLTAKFFEGEKTALPIEEYTLHIFIVTLCHEAFGDSQLDNMMMTFKNKVYLAGDIWTKEYVDQVCTATIAVGIRTPKLWTAGYRNNFTGKRRQVWDEFIHNCLHTLPELDMDSWLKFRDFEISVGY